MALDGFRFRNAPLSLRILVTMAIIGMGITYMVLALHIFIDTEFKVSLIKQAYENMEWTELVDHTHKYFPYYAIYIFAFTLFIFILGTSYSEWLKIGAAVIPNCLIILDIGSMWAIRYINAVVFSWGLFLAGNLLAASFGLLSALILYDIWLKKK